MNFRILSSLELSLVPLAFSHLLFSLLQELPLSRRYFLLAAFILFFIPYSSSKLRIFPFVFVLFFIIIIQI